MDPNISPWIESAIISGQKPPKGHVVQILSIGKVLRNYPEGPETLVRAVCGDSQTKINTIFTTTALVEFRKHSSQFSQTKFEDMRHDLVRLEDCSLGFAHDGPCLTIHSFVFLTTNLNGGEIRNSTVLNYVDARRNGPVHERMKLDQVIQAQREYDACWMPKKMIDVIEEQKFQDDDMDLDGIDHEPRDFGEIESAFQWNTSAPGSLGMSSLGSDRNEPDTGFLDAGESCLNTLQPLISSQSPLPSPKKALQPAPAEEPRNVPEAASVASNLEVASQAEIQQRGTQEESLGFSLADNQAGMLDVLASQLQHESPPAPAASSLVQPFRAASPSPPAAIASAQDIIESLDIPPEQQPPTEEKEEQRSSGDIHPAVPDPPSTPESDGWEDNKMDQNDNDESKNKKGGVDERLQSLQDSMNEPVVSSDEEEDAAERLSPSQTKEATELRSRRIIPEYDYSILEASFKRNYIRGADSLASQQLQTQLATQIPAMYSPPPPASQSQESERSQRHGSSALESVPAAQQIVSLEILPSVASYESQQQEEAPVAQAPSKNGNKQMQPKKPRKNNPNDDSVLAESDSEESQNSDISTRRRKAASQKGDSIMLLDDLSEPSQDRIEIDSDQTPPKRGGTPPTPAAAAADSSIDIFHSRGTPQSPIPSRSSSSPFDTPQQAAPRRRITAASSPSAASPVKPLPPPPMVPSPQKQQKEQINLVLPKKPMSGKDVSIRLEKRNPRQPRLAPAPKANSPKPKPQTHEEDYVGVDEDDDFFDAATIPKKRRKRQQPEEQPEPKPVASPIVDQPPKPKPKPQLEEPTKPQHESTESSSSRGAASRKSSGLIKDNLGPIEEPMGPRRRTSTGSQSSANNSLNGEQQREDLQPELARKPTEKLDKTKDNKQKNGDGAASQQSPNQSRRQFNADPEAAPRSEAARFRAIEESSKRKRSVDEIVDEGSNQGSQVEESARKRRKPNAKEGDEQAGAGAGSSSASQTEETSRSRRKSAAPSRAAEKESSPTKPQRKSLEPAAVTSAERSEQNASKKRKSVDSSHDADPSADAVNESAKKRRKTGESTDNQQRQQSKISSYFETKSPNAVQKVIPDTPPQLRKPQPRRPLEVNWSMEEDVFEPAESSRSSKRSHSPVKERQPEASKPIKKSVVESRQDDSVLTTSAEKSRPAPRDSSPKKRAPTSAQKLPSPIPKPVSSAKVLQSPPQEQLPAPSKPPTREKSTEPAPLVQEKPAPAPPKHKPTAAPFRAEPQTEQRQPASRPLTTASSRYEQVVSSRNMPAQPDLSAVPLYLDLTDEAPARKKPQPAKPWNRMDRETSPAVMPNAPANEEEEQGDVFVEADERPRVGSAGSTNGRNHQEKRLVEENDDNSEEWIARGEPKGLPKAVLVAAQAEQERRRAAAASKRSGAQPPPPINRSSSGPPPTTSAPQQPRPPTKSPSAPLPGQTTSIPTRVANTTAKAPTNPPQQQLQQRQQQQPQRQPQAQPQRQPLPSKKRPEPVADDDDPFSDFDVKPLSALLPHTKRQ